MSARLPLSVFEKPIPEGEVAHTNRWRSFDDFVGVRPTGRHLNISVTSNGSRRECMAGGNMLEVPDLIPGPNTTLLKAWRALETRDQSRRNVFPALHLSQTPACEIHTIVLRFEKN